MPRSKLVMTLLSLTSLVLSDFEDCKKVSLTSNKLGLSSLEIAGEDFKSDGATSSDKLEIKFDSKTSITEPVSIQKDQYDGFFCWTDSKESFSPLEPCKNYIVHAEKQTRYFPNSMRCYRAVDSADPSQTSFILILNRINQKENIWKSLHTQNSYELSIRFLAAMTDWVKDTISFVEPLIDESDKLIKGKITRKMKKKEEKTVEKNGKQVKETSEKEIDEEVDAMLINSKYWFTSLVVERSPDDRIFVRYRYISTVVDDPADKNRVSAIVEDVFRIVKNFFYFNTSCFSIIHETVEMFKGKELWALLKNHPGYPRNYGLIMDLLKKGYIGIVTENGPMVSLSHDLAHMYLIQTVIFGYCIREIRFTQQQLTGLNILLRSLFSRDIFFKTFDESEEFEAFFRWNEDKIITAPSDSSEQSADFEKTEVGKFFKDFGIVDHPPFMSKADRIKAESARHFLQMQAKANDWKLDLKKPLKRAN